MAKKPKVKKEKPKKAAKEAEGAEGEGSKKGGLIGKLALGLALAAASFGTVFFIPGPPAAETAYSSGDAHAAVEEEVEPLELKPPSTFVALSPFTISLDGGNSLLRIGITLEASEAESDYIDPDDPRMRDAFTGYLRALQPSQIRDAAYMARLRAQLLRRARLVFGEDAVHGILITDFLVQ